MPCDRTYALQMCWHKEMVRLLRLQHYLAEGNIGWNYLLMPCDRTYALQMCWHKETVRLLRLQHDTVEGKHPGRGWDVSFLKVLLQLVDVRIMCSQDSPAMCAAEELLPGTPDMASPNHACM